MIVESLELLLGFKFDKEELKKFDESVKTINKSLIALGTTVLASASAITAMTLSSSRSAVDMLKLSSATGTAVANLEALEYVSAQNSIQSSTLSGALESVRNNIAGISKGSGSALEAFSMLGISAFGADGKLRDSYETMKEATEKLSKMTDATRQAEYAQQIFGGSASEMMFMIRKGSQAFADGEDAMRKYGSSLSRNDLENVAKFSQSWDQLTNSFSQFTEMVWGKLAPSMNDLINSFLEWWAINKEMITQNVIKYYKIFAEIIGTIISYFWEFSKVISRVVDQLGGFERVLRLTFYALTSILALKFLVFLGTLATMASTVGTAIMAMNMKALLLPMLIGVGIALAVMIIEDFYVFLKGGKSLLGKILGEWEEPVRNFATAWGETWDEAMEVWGANGFLGTLAKAFDGAVILFENFINDIGLFFDRIVQKIVDKAIEIKDAITSPFTEAFDDVKDSSLFKGFMAGVKRTTDSLGITGNANNQLPVRAEGNNVTNQVFNNNAQATVHTNSTRVVDAMTQSVNASYSQTVQELSRDWGR